MKDTRISIRLSDLEHKKFKMIAINNNTSMQSLLVEYVRNEIKKVENEKN